MPALRDNYGLRNLSCLETWQLCTGLDKTRGALDIVIGLIIKNIWELVFNKNEQSCQQYIYTVLKLQGLKENNMPMICQTSIPHK